MKIYVIYHLPGTGSGTPRCKIMETDHPFRWTEKQIAGLLGRIASEQNADDTRSIVITDVKNLEN